MKTPLHTPNHVVAPKEFRSIPNLTGSYELDRVISENPNPNLQDRFEFYGGRAMYGYGPRSAYNGYSGYSGDE